MREDFVELGYLGKAHGLKGEIKAVFDVHDIREYLKVKKLHLAKKDAPIEVRKVKRIAVQKAKQLIIKFEGVNYRDEAEALTGSTVYFPMADLPELEEGRFYYFQVIGFAIEDKTHGPLGTISQIIDGPAQDILVMDYQGKEILIPMTDEFVGEADMEAKKVMTALPEGLLEAYLEE
ncbi:MAG: ribosome maturation factor RimM [Bacteroidota bacterium]